MPYAPTPPPPMASATPATTPQQLLSDESSAISEGSSGDDGANVAVLIETLRALAAGPALPLPVLLRDMARGLAAPTRAGGGPRDEDGTSCDVYAPSKRRRQSWSSLVVKVQRTTRPA